jgi:hypothetical protein
VLIPTGLNSFKPSKVVVKAKKVSNGFYAPLTTEGNIVVDGVLTSCYGIINIEFIAHAAFAPVRAVHWLLQYISLPFNYAIDGSSSNGVHWYAEVLYDIGILIFDKSVIFSV